MAGESDKEDRTEAATAKRLQRAHDDGQAPLSREAAGLAVLASAIALIATKLSDLAHPHIIALTRLMQTSQSLRLDEALHVAGGAAFGLIWPFMAAAVLAACIAVLAQTKLTLRMSALVPDVSHINPGAGLARLFGRQKLTDTGIAVLKVAAMGFFALGALRELLPMLPQLFNLPPLLLSAQLQDRVVAVAMSVLTVQAVVAAVDILRTHLRFHGALRMTRQELRDESRESEGDPHVKGRIRQIRLQRAKRRMMAAVPKATVVVTNPTHYAVALSYERGQGGAPRIVAKGVDEVAARIREVARSSGVPLVANPPLARALYPLPLDAEVPAEHFKAVAELIAYVWHLSQPQRTSR